MIAIKSRSGRRRWWPLLVVTCACLVAAACSSSSSTTPSSTASASAGTSDVAYVRSPAGRALYVKGGYTLLKPVPFGNTADIPAPVKAELSS